MMCALAAINPSTTHSDSESSMTKESTGALLIQQSDARGP
jgi:hypothetical protein